MSPHGLETQSDQLGHSAPADSIRWNGPSDVYHSTGHGESRDYPSSQVMEQRSWHLPNFLNDLTPIHSVKSCLYIKGWVHPLVSHVLCPSVSVLVWLDK